MRKILHRLLISGIILLMNNLFIFSFSYNPRSEHPDIASVIIADTISKSYKQEFNRINVLNAKIEQFLTKGDTINSGLLLQKILSLISDNPSIDSTDLIKPYYFMGIHFWMTGKSLEAFEYLQSALDISEKFSDDKMSARILYFLGYSNSLYGDHIKSNEYFVRSLNLEKEKIGRQDLELINIYNSLTISNSQIRDYEKAIEYVNKGLEIADAHLDSIPPDELANLYLNRGVAFAYMADYSQSMNNFKKAEKNYISNSKQKTIEYMKILGNIATDYYYMGMPDQCIDYYKKGINYATNSTSQLAFVFVTNYAIILGKNGMSGKGEKLLEAALDRAKKINPFDPKLYFELLKNYAEYLRDNSIDKHKACDLFIKCYDYVNSHPWDINLNDDIAVGYSLSLLDIGESDIALDTVQSLLFRNQKKHDLQDRFANPDFKAMRFDKKSLDILKTKYRIMWSVYNKSNEFKTIESAAKTLELLIAVLERIRLNIGEEESRLLLGDKYSDSYIYAIQCFNICYDRTQNPYYLEKVYEYSEKSKVASLLASTREMKATQFHIPSDLADLENSLQRGINFYNAKIDQENSREVPDLVRIGTMNDIVMDAMKKRDSLKRVFEKTYPEYFLVKYNTEVLKMENIPGIIGRNKNYISYVVTDSSLYILVVNKRYKQLISFNIDSSFFNTISRFKKLLSLPQFSGNARNDFYHYQSDGYKLYTYLIEPVKKYLISNNMVVSPDNVLAYLPFETFLSEDSHSEDMLYRKLPFLMNDFNFSYTYSATLLSESVKKRSSFINHALVFVPSYNSSISVDSLFLKRQAEGQVLRDLPYAREEAKYILEKLGGRLYINDLATKSAFNSEAGQFDIIHLAMHTVLNDENPMYSKMVFATVNDSADNRDLNTYEIYGIKLKAKMVVLSSCNTGTGELHKGEGILSLARGFIYSGSRSVVMSLWEVEDRSGTEIIKSFYDNLKKGNSKGVALRRSRLKYLKRADQLRSHPYFWSTLIIYGDDSPLYYSLSVKLFFVLIPSVLICSVILYFRKRKYS